MGRGIVETLIGALVLSVALFFLFIAFNTTAPSNSYGYKINAKFLKVGGIEIGSDVRISGINVGSIINQYLDTNTYEANLILLINENIKLPIDTQAKIVGDGILGSKYIDLIPGKESQLIEDGEYISDTRDYVSLEDMIGDIIFQLTDN